MNDVKIQHHPTEKTLTDLKIKEWPLWSKEVSKFEWFYDEEETCYFLEGQVKLDIDNGRLEFGKGDLVTFPKGLSCTWNITMPVRKHYKFGK